MSRKKEKQKQDNSRVEFGNELGDFNSAKVYEIKHMSKSKSKQPDDSDKGCGGL
ncbi:hypothetical protein GCM10008967_13680 [Bacillus carboniphilus]|uniref:Uncharacterized protein n=1 Tax=Bacillus carboniphilus TaxID=86663 RepID=A0ABN0W3U2_9BACI